MATKEEKSQALKEYAHSLLELLNMGIVLHPSKDSEVVFESLVIRLKISSRLNSDGTYLLVATLPSEALLLIGALAVTNVHDAKAQVPFTKPFKNQAVTCQGIEPLLLSYNLFVWRNRLNQLLDGLTDD